MDPTELRTSGPPGINTRSSISNTAADLEILKEIDDIYFSDPKTFDAARHVLENTPDLDKLEAVEAAFTKLKRQHQVISGKALHVISQQRDNCDREFVEVQNIGKLVSSTLEVCREARSQLLIAKNNLTVTSFTILGNFRKRKIIKEVLSKLEIIKELKNADANVSELLSKNDFEGAISLIVKYKKEAAANKEFVCVQALANRLQDTQESVEEKLDSTLAMLCKNFDGAVFLKVRRAYVILGKLQTAMEHLFMHYSSALHEASLESVKRFSNSNDLKYQDLCAGVPVGDASNCLLDLCENLYSIMKSYYLLCKWHRENDTTNEIVGNATVDFENNISREYIDQKISAGLPRIWTDVQSKVSVFLKSVGIEQFPFEKFVQVLGVLKKLTQVAEVFCGDRSDLLKDFMKNQSLAYIQNYHRGRLEELKLFLENEGWESCPVKSSFSIFNLHEFKPFKKYLKGFKSDMSRTQSDGTSSDISQDNSTYIAKYFTSNTKHTPFELFRNETVSNDDIFGVESDLSDSDDELDELKQDFLDENPDRPEKSPKKLRNSVIVTNTTLSLLRICGQYLQMCRYLKPIALEVIMLIFQLYDFYMYTVHLFFTSDLEVARTTLYTPKLNAVLKRINNSLNVNGEGDHKIVLAPEIPNHIRLDDESNLHALPERIAGVESMIFLAKQYEILYPYLESLVEQHQKMILELYRDNTLSVCTDLRQPIYMSSTSKAVDLKKILVSMTSVKWDVKEVALENSPYVDLIVRQIQFFALRLDNVAERVPVTQEVSEAIWSMLAKFIVHLLVEGYSNTNKCSNAGRGLMQLDSTQIVVKLEKISGMKPMPYQDYLDKYIKAYYFPRNLLEDFVKERNGYSNKQLASLVACACENKRDRQELMGFIENRNS